MCDVYLWDLCPSPSDLWDLMVCVSLVPRVPSVFNFSKKCLIPRSQTRDLDQGLEHLYHCARHLAVHVSHHDGWIVEEEEQEDHNDNILPDFDELV